MTLRELTYEESGMELQGDVIVQSWDDDKEDEFVHYREVINSLVMFPEELLDRKIAYIYPTIRIDISGRFETPVIIIEID